LSDRRCWLASYPEGVPKDFRAVDELVPGLLEQTVATYSGKTALRFFLHPRLPPSTMSYGSLNALSTRFATALVRLGVRKGDRIALVLPNCPEYAIAYFGALQAGAIVVNASPLYVADELQRLFQDSGCQVAVYWDALHQRIESIRTATALAHAIVVRLEDNLPHPWRGAVACFRRIRGERPRLRSAEGLTTFASFMHRGEQQRGSVTLRPDDVALLQYTGGTTGVPKAAMLTHRNLVSNTLQVLSWSVGVQRGAEVVLGALPFFHVYGMTTALLYALASGSELVLMPSPRPIEAVLRVLAKSRATIFPGVPTMYLGINLHPRVSRFDLSHVKLCISGAAPLPREVQERFEELTGGKLVEGYGLTEASPVTHCNPLVGSGKPGSIGLPLPGVDARLVDDDGREMPVGEIGELLVRGPQVMKGYWNRKDETELALSDGWLHTGDLGHMDDDGFFYIDDRKKDMIDASGLKVYPREVEEVLYRHPKVQEAIVIGVPDPYRGETVKAFVVLKPGERADEDEIASYCSEHLARYKVPKQVEFRSELPRSAVGKPLRRVLVAEERKRRDSV
jgi:long-chain acyl-CoA synthetase